jgi:hypothetical protein
VRVLLFPWYLLIASCEVVAAVRVVMSLPLTCFVSIHQSSPTSSCGCIVVVLSKERVNCYS